MHLVMRTTRVMWRVVHGEEIVKSIVNIEILMPQQPLPLFLHISMTELIGTAKTTLRTVGTSEIMSQLFLLVVGSREGHGWP